MDGLGRSQRTVRPGVWFCAVGSIVFLLVIALGLEFVEPVHSKHTAAKPVLAKPLRSPDTVIDDAINLTVDPLQSIVTNREPMLMQDGDVTWQLKPRATLIIAGRMVSSRSYQDHYSALIPVDLLLTWGDLSNPEADQWISWAQSGRAAYFHQPHNSPFTKNYMISHATNIHVIPATEKLETAVMELAPDEDVLLEGLLVDVESTSQGIIFTSLARTDTGEGACEILYLERLVVDGMEYR